MKDEGGKNMRQITVAMIAIIIAITIGIFYVYGDKIENSANLTKPALKLTISTDTDTKEDSVKITNITFEQTTVPVYYRSVDSPVNFPDIDVEAKNGTLKSAPVSYWASAKRTTPNGTYVLMLTFREPYKPVTGELLILTVRMNNFRGKLEYKTTAFYDWK